MAQLPASIPSKIIICCDGTWQSAVSGEENSPSNVTRLARSLNRVAKQDGKVWQQIVWYDSGIGTTSGWLGKKLEGAIGAGIEGNIIEAYNFVVLNWTPGDQVLCFGFSRGAYTARSIAGLISDIGICKPGRLQGKRTSPIIKGSAFKEVMSTTTTWMAFSPRTKTSRTSPAMVTLVRNGRRNLEATGQ